jgi:hypothetical protein
MRLENNSKPNNPKPTATTRWAFFCAAALVAPLALTACRAGPKNFDNENDALRRELLGLRAESERLRNENAELRAKLSEATRVRDAATGPGADVVAAMPRCAGIEVGSRSGWAPDGGGVEALIETFDARKRFVQVAGTLTVDVTRLPAAGADGGGKAETLGTVRLGPGELREAYRSSFMGTHYVAVVPVVAGSKGGAGTVVLRAVLQDGVTGATYEGTRVLK